MAYDQNSTSLYKVLSGLNLTDQKLYEKLSLVSGSVDTIKGDYLTSATFLTAEGKVKADFLDGDLGDISTLMQAAITGVATTETTSGSVDENKISIDVLIDDNTMHKDNSTHLGVKYNLSSLKADADGLAVKHNNTISDDPTAGIGVKYDESSIGINTSGQLKVLANSDKTILTSSGLQVNVGNTLKVDSETGKINVNIDGSSLSATTDGLIKANVELKKLSGDAVPTGDASAYQLYVGGSPVGDKIQVIKDQFLKSATYDETTQKLTFTFDTKSGEKSTDVSLSGLVDEYSAAPSGGLSVSDNKFKIDLKTNSGLKTTENGLEVLLEANKGLAFSTSGEIGVKAANGVSVGADGVGVKANDAKGVAVTSDGVEVKLGKGLDFRAASQATSGKIDVQTGNGIEIDTNNKVGIKKDSTNTESFLYVDANGLGVSGIQAAINTTVSGVSGGLNTRLSAAETKISGTIEPNITTLSGLVSGYSGVAAISAAISANTTNITTLSTNIGDGFSSTATVASKITSLTGDFGKIQKMLSGYTLGDAYAISSAIATAKTGAETTAENKLKEMIWGASTVTTAANATSTSIEGRLAALQAPYTELIKNVEKTMSDVAGM